jgi:SAM-dependent methyltransferase
MQKIKPYDKLASIYDRLMEHVNYPHWCQYIQTFFPCADIQVNTILDLSCGTGNLITCFHNYSYKIYGCDYSPSMVYEAKKKNRFPLFITDGCSMAIKNNTFNVILFMYDSLNYLLNSESVAKLLREVKRVLTPGGLFIFDVVTDFHCRTYYNDYHENEFWDGIGYNRHGYYLPDSFLQINEFQIIEVDKHYLEIHQQKIYSIREISGLIKTSGLAILQITEDFSLTTGSEKSERIHFICKKNRFNS